jgi:hypothetical protein
MFVAFYYGDMLGQSWFLVMAVIGQNCAARLGNRVYATNFALTFLPSLITNSNIAKGLCPATDKNTAIESLWVEKALILLSRCKIGTSLCLLYFELETVGKVA